MVCLPCFAAPVLLFIWYKFIYPILRPLLQRYFGDRWFALPQDSDNCPICPRNSQGKCDLKATSTSKIDSNEPAANEPLSESTNQEATSKKDK